MVAYQGQIAMIDVVSSLYLLITNNVFATPYPPEEWKGILRIRGRRHHAQCHECATISHLRSKAQTEQEKKTLAVRSLKVGCGWVNLYDWVAQLTKI